MSDPNPPEDPIWSRWRERRRRGNGAPPREAAPEPAPPPREPERIRLGDPLDPDWAAGHREQRLGEEPPPPPESESSPPNSPPRAHPHSERECLEWCPICRGAEVVRASFPPEVRAQLESVQHDALVAMRSVLDHYIERVDAAERPASRVEDIPIQ